MKIDNMREEHQEKLIKDASRIAAEKKAEEKAEEKKEAKEADSHEENERDIKGDH